MSRAMRRGVSRRKADAPVTLPSNRTMTLSPLTCTARMLPAFAAAKGNRPTARPTSISTDRYVRTIKVRRSEEHTSELQSLMRISYAVFCLKKKKHSTERTQQRTAERRCEARGPSADIVQQQVRSQ